MRLTIMVSFLWAAVACGDDSTGVPPGGDGGPSDGASGGDGLGGVDGPGGGPDGSGMCPSDPSPPGTATCPDVCTGGCTDGVCTIDCATHNCDGDTHDCPEEYACAIVCTGVDHCDGGEVNCPPDYPCSVSCGGGNDACGDLELNCGNGSCSLQCEADACSGATITCGDGACSASCDGTPAPTVDCGGSCSCTEC
jgi:hypothetical protein